MLCNIVRYKSGDSFSTVKYLTFSTYLSLLENGASGQRLVEHFDIGMLRQVVKSTQVTNETLQLLKKLRRNEPLGEQFPRSGAIFSAGNEQIYQRASFSHILQALQHFRQTRIIGVDKPYWGR